MYQFFLTFSNLSGKFRETQVNLQDHKNKADFDTMSVAELKKYLHEQGISASG